jgi:hypothetical protein
MPDMHVAAKQKLARSATEPASSDLSTFVPEEFSKLDDPQTAIPRLARDERAVGIIEDVVRRISTRHRLYLGDARKMPQIEPESVHRF